MEKTLNQRIHEIPLDIKQAIYDRGYEAGKQSATKENTACWEFDYTYAKCSNCGGGVDVYISRHYKFCPFCGKTMTVNFEFNFA